MRSKILSTLTFASCVWYSDRAYYGLCVLFRDIMYQVLLYYCSERRRTIHCEAPAPVALFEWRQTNERYRVTHVNTIWKLKNTPAVRSKISWKLIFAYTCRYKTPVSANVGLLPRRRAKWYGSDASGIGSSPVVKWTPLSWVEQQREYVHYLWFANRNLCLAALSPSVWLVLHASVESRNVGSLYFPFHTLEVMVVSLPDYNDFWRSRLKTFFSRWFQRLPSETACTVSQANTFIPLVLHRV